MLSPWVKSPDSIVGGAVEVVTAAGIVVSFMATGSGSFTVLLVNKAWIPRKPKRSQRTALSDRMATMTLRGEIRILGKCIERGSCSSSHEYILLLY